MRTTNSCSDVFEGEPLSKMTEPFRYQEGRPVVWCSRNPAESNHHCPYCCGYLGPSSDLPSDKEHLVGRNFVPNGYLDRGAFNFIFRACRECNAGKADAERHVSTLTLFRTPDRASDESLDKLAVRKAKRDYHPLEKGKFVHDAHLEYELAFQEFFGPMLLTVVGPLQLDQRLVSLLAVRQVQALFALVTTQDPRVRELTRVCNPNDVVVFGYYDRDDWGNPQVLQLIQRTGQWDCPIRLVTARGYFKAVLKRATTDNEGWFWGLEWNRALRVFGAIAQRTSLPQWLVHNLPDLHWFPEGGPHRFRQHIPLADEQDTFFLIPGLPDLR